MVAGDIVLWSSAGTRPRLKIGQQKRGCDGPALPVVTVQPQTWWKDHHVDLMRERWAPTPGTGTAYRPPESGPESTGMGTRPLSSTRRGLSPVPSPLGAFVGVQSSRDWGLGCPPSSAALPGQG